MKEKGFSKIVKFLKSIKIYKDFIQLSHSGKKGSSEIPWIKPIKPLYKNKWKTISSSQLKKTKLAISKHKRYQENNKRFEKSAGLYSLLVSMA